MGFEVTYKYHARKEDGGYETKEIKELKKRVGEVFEDTPLEKLAAQVMSNLARRDIWVIDVEIEEYVKRPVSFKESKDGRGIVLKNKKFSLDSTANMVAEEEIDVPPVHTGLQPHELAQLARQQGQQPHEIIRQQQQVDDLYNQPNRSVPIKRTAPQAPVNQKKVLHYVFFEPYMYEEEAKRAKLKFTIDKKYPVHQIIERQPGKLDLRDIVVTDDTGRMTRVDEKFFTSAGMGLYGDKEVGFSEPVAPRSQSPKLLFDNDLIVEVPPEVRAKYGNIPLDNGKLSSEVLRMPDIRPGRSL